MRHKRCIYIVFQNPRITILIFFKTPADLISILASTKRERERSSYSVCAASKDADLFLRGNKTRAYPPPTIPWRVIAVSHEYKKKKKTLARSRRSKKLLCAPLRDIDLHNSLGAWAEIYRGCKILVHVLWRGGWPLSKENTIDVSRCLYAADIKFYDSRDCCICAYVCQWTIRRVYNSKSLGVITAMCGRYRFCLALLNVFTYIYYTV